MSIICLQLHEACEIFVEGWEQYSFWTQDTSQILLHSFHSDVSLASAPYKLILILRVFRFWILVLLWTVNKRKKKPKYPNRKHMWKILSLMPDTDDAMGEEEKIRFTIRKRKISIFVVKKVLPLRTLWHTEKRPGAHIYFIRRIFFPARIHFG